MTSETWLGRLRRRNPWRGFLLDLAVSIGLSFGLSWAMWVLFAWMGDVAVWMLALSGLIYVFPVIVFAPFAAVMLYGWIGGRAGLLLGPVLLAVGTYLTSISIIWFQQQEISKLTPPASAPSRPDHTLLALASHDAPITCEGYCVHVLAKSPVAIAISNEAILPRWYVYRLGDGEVCRRDANARTTLAFLHAGYLGKCGLEVATEELGDALIFRTRIVGMGISRPAKDLPWLFSGTAYETFERTGGNERLLARRLSGSLTMPMPSALSAFTPWPEKVEDGPIVDLKQFVAAAARIPADDLLARGPDDFAARLDAVEAFFDYRPPAIANRALLTWERIAKAEGRSHPNELRARLERFAASNNPGRQRIARNLMAH